MRRVVCGKIFDTELSTKICYLRVCTPKPGFTRHDNTLYLSPNGRLFLADAQVSPSIQIITEDTARAIMEEACCMEPEFKLAGLSLEEG